MGEDNGKDRALPFSAILVVLAAVGVIVFNKVPLEGSRPAVNEIPEQHNLVKARLWEDPFLAVLHQANGKAPPADSGCFGLSAPCNDVMKGDCIRKQMHDKVEKGKVTVVAVMVFGAPYAEEGEMRIRHRYAALSAFNHLGFVPDDSEHVQYLKIDHRTSAQESVANTLSMTDLMPYEWLSRMDGKNDSVLLLWINDEIFHSSPLSKLKRLAECLQLPSPVQGGKPVAFKIIGPAGSTTLKAMIEEQNAPAAGCPIEMYSSTASVDDALLSPHPMESASWVKSQFQRAGIQFERTINSDGQLAKLIYEELANRGINCKKKKQHIVLLAEWDSFYARAMSEVFLAAFSEKWGPSAGDRIHLFTYLRGVDGKVPSPEDEKEGQKLARDGEKKESDAIKEMEKASGLSQLDYVRRLADEVHRFEANLDPDESIRAIGILGSDFYDKYLLLQAMRQRFPQSIFFTTNLDARLLHPEAVQWTRNLLVASSFDLALRNDKDMTLQEVPPFRDSYQTSIFFSILRSFAKENYLGRFAQNVMLQTPQPNIYEIGRYHAINLSRSAGVTAGFDPYHDLQRRRTIILKVLLIVGAASVLLTFTSKQIRDFFGKIISGWRPALAGCLAGAGILLLLSTFCGILKDPSEEPLYFLEGVSIWPTEIIRVIGLLLSLVFMWRIRTDSQGNRRAITEEFRLPCRDPLMYDQSSFLQWGAGVWNRFNAGFRKFSGIVGYDSADPGVTLAKEDLGNRDGGEAGTMAPFWDEYCRRDSGSYRFRRVVPVIVSYILLCSLIISFSPPFAPVRGTVSTVVDRVALFLLVFFFITLTCYTYDVINTCRHFIELVAEKTPAWSDESYDAVVGAHAKKSEEVLKEWLLVRLIAKRTSTIGKAVFYPFIVWSLAFVSRLSFFDNWQTPISLVIVISLGAAFAWTSAYLLRKAAERARQASLTRLLAIQTSAYASSKPDEEYLRCIDLIISNVKGVREGAFLPFMQCPMVQALLVPFGGVGGAYALDIMGKLNI
ncbi:hypothetical protein [Geomonas sp.]|uniref:hypothetical protein n=1 Tax=Geomonas sp. TaxID=2651584 RepID=UPI002B46DCD7|nr:hypothetical protein [Geomonas sp.]HJV35189.1 hypothetical protein [Geomonas sp.]